jgi:ankyrin repeat protein
VFLFGHPAEGAREAGAVEAREARWVLERLGFEVTGVELLRLVGTGAGELVDTFLKAGVETEVRDEQGRTPVLLAAAGGNWGLVERLVNAGCSVTAQDQQGRGLLTAAVVQKQKAWVERFLEAGLDPEPRDHSGHGPLHYAVMAQETDLVRHLMGKTQNRMEPCCEGKDLLDHALERDSTEVVDTVLEGIPIQENWRPAAMETLMVALADQEKKRVRFLLSRHAVPPISPVWGQPLTACALAERNRPVFRLLLECGADPNQELVEPVGAEFLARLPSGGVRQYAERASGVNLVMLAAGLAWSEEVELLLQLGAKRKGLTRGSVRVEPLHFASCSQDWRTLHVLFAGAPDPDALRVEISISAQRAELYRNGKSVFRTEVSTGRPGFPTPKGEFVVTDKHMEHVSTIYKQPMPYFCRLNFREFGMHAGITELPFASHGCIRLPSEVAKRFFGELPLGTLVRIRE